MDKNTLFDKIYGCWCGKNIGGTIGAPYEGRKEVFNLSFYDPIPEKAAPNDDLDLQIVWLDVLKQKGTGITSRDMGQAWLKHVTYHCDEYGVALANLKLGLEPPVSGYYNNWFQNSMGAPIRSEIWAAVAPGKPEVAAYYAYQDASADHYGEGVYGEIFLAALESMAFITNDLNQIINTGLSFLPESSRLYQAINFTRNLYSKKISRPKAREQILEKFGHFNVTDCIQNICFIVLGLLYGQGDFEKTILSAVNCGYDTDCTAATTGAIMGILLGIKGIPERWKAPIGDRVIMDARIVGIKPPENLLRLTEETIAVGELFSRSNPKTLPKPFRLPPAGLPTSKPFSFPFIINGNGTTTFTDFHFNLNPYFDKTPGTIKLATFIDNPVSRKVRILPACNDGVKLWLDGNLVLSHHEHNPVRPAPHYPEQSRFVDLELSEGRHKIDLEISCCRKPLEFSWVVSERNEYLLFPLITDLKYFLQNGK